MNFTERRRRFREILTGDECVYAPCVFDAVSSRIAEELGYEFGVAQAISLEATVVGGTEYGTLTITEIAEQVRRICRASSISVLVASARGIGNALNLIRCVEELESAGASGLALDANTVPIAFGSPTFRSAMEKGIEERRNVDHEPELPMEVMVNNIKAALAARQDGLAILARVHVPTEADVPEVIRRIKAYESAGVDGIWVGGFEKGAGWKGKSSLAALEAIHAASKLPLVIGGSVTDWVRKAGDEQFLAKNGVRISSLGRNPFLASMKAIYDCMEAQRMGITQDKLRSSGAVASRELEAKILREQRDDERIKAFLYP